jgi:VanZ family protein
MLQNYLQDFINSSSKATFEVAGVNFSYVLIIGLTFLGTFIFLSRKQITVYRLTFLAVIGVMWLLIGQKTADYYFNHKFYELQHNWHYIAYSIYAYLSYRLMMSKKVDSSRIIIRTFFSAFLITLFDEGIQVFISNRIFDICDIGKDLWGTVIGLVFVFFVLEEGKIYKQSSKLTHKKLKDYFKSPFSMIVFLILLAYINLLVSSKLTDTQFIPSAALIILLIFSFIFFIVHFLQFRKGRIFIITFLAAAIFIQGFFFIKYMDKNIIYYKKGLVIYKGIPLPYFDIMIHNNGTIKLVDKKIFFNGTDIKTIMHKSTRILLIGSGSKGQGGKGFLDNKEAQFYFNPITLQPLEIIIMNTKEACKKYNQLKKQGLEVVFVIHNS